MTPTTRRKAVVMRSLAVVLSLAPIVVAEGLLRAVDYGFATSLFVPNRLTHSLEINPDFYKTYFSSGHAALQSGKLISGLFERPGLGLKIVKPASEFRILTLGGSTTKGTGASPNFTQLLEAMLTRQDVDRDIDVTNLGFTTLNSFQVVDFVQEVTNYQPDLLIVYMGHNEIYGPLGAGSNFRTGNSYRFTKLHTALRHSRLFQLLEAGVSSLLPSDEPPRSDASLFRHMAQRAIPPNSEIRAEALESFARNLDAIIRHCESSKIPLLVTTISSNILHFRPFDSEVPTDPVLLRKWRDASAQAEKTGTIADLVTAINVFPTNAQQHYDLGQLYLEAGRVAEARTELVTAKKFDILPFRASERINDEIRSQARAHDLLFLDVDELFRAGSPNGLVGKPIMVDHLHPSTYGHYLIAVGLVETILDNSLLRARADLRFEQPDVMTSFLVRLNDIDLSSDFTAVWPFSINNADYHFP